MRRASLSIIVRGATSVKVWCGKWVRAEQGLVERFGAIPSAINPEEGLTSRLTPLPPLSPGTLERSVR